LWKTDLPLHDGRNPACPYYQWTRKIKGKTVNINLDKEAAAIVQEWIQNSRKLHRLRTRLEKTSLEVLRIIADVRKT
jgi:hypothetical protein